jgi:hypothetical protein
VKVSFPLLPSTESSPPWVRSKLSTCDVPVRVSLPAVPT